MNLVYINERDKEPYTLSTVIAECAEVQHATVKRLMTKHKKELEEFGLLRFEIVKPQKGSKGGRPTKVYILNEQQATLLITWLDNTEPVRAFKLALVKAFFELRNEVMQFRLQRELEKPKRRELTDAIKQWKYANKYSYKHMTDLLFKLTTGKNAKQLKITRQDNNTALDVLSAEELVTYQRYEAQVIALIELQLNFEAIKEITARTLQAIK